MVESSLKTLIETRLFSSIQWILTFFLLSIFQISPPEFGLPSREHYWNPKYEKVYIFWHFLPVTDHLTQLLQNLLNCFFTFEIDLLSSLWIIFLYYDHLIRNNGNFESVFLRVFLGLTCIPFNLEEWEKILFKERKKEWKTFNEWNIIYFLRKFISRSLNKKTVTLGLVSFKSLAPFDIIEVLPFSSLYLFWRVTF